MDLEASCKVFYLSERSVLYMMRCGLIYNGCFQESFDLNSVYSLRL